MPNDINNITTIQPTSRNQTFIKDLIGHPPGWLLHSGITMIGIVTTILLTGAYFFKYPDKLTGQGMLTSTTPPIEILSRSGGYIGMIHYNEGDFVRKGDPILYINNTTDNEQLSQLQDWIKEYENIKNPLNYLNLYFVNGLQLGVIQGDYANLQLKFNEMQQTLLDGVVFQQIKNLSREIEKIKMLNDSKEREKNIFKKELKLAKKDYLRNESLKNEGVVTELDLERVKSSVLQKERQYEGMNNSTISNTIRIEQLELEKLKLQDQRSKAIKGYINSISETNARIRSSIEQWKNTYTIVATIDGVLTFHKDITVNRNLILGQTIGYIMPEIGKEKYVSALYSGNNIGKVKKGQKVILKFDAYPYKEFGVILSKVSDISRIPEEDNAGNSKYELKFPVNNKLFTDYGQELKYKPNMTVTADVITEDKTVFARIFNQFLSMVNQQNK